MSEQFIEGANAAGIPMEVLHRVASMASGGMDTLPHRQSYGDIFFTTCTKTAAVFIVIVVYRMTGLV